MLLCAGVPRLAHAEAERPRPQTVASLGSSDLDVKWHGTLQHELFCLWPFPTCLKVVRARSSPAIAPRRTQLYAANSCGVRLVPKIDGLQGLHVSPPPRPPSMHRGKGGRVGVAKDVAPRAQAQNRPSTPGVVQRARMHCMGSSAAMVGHPLRLCFFSSRVASNSALAERLTPAGLASRTPTLVSTASLRIIFGRSGNDDEFSSCSGGASGVSLSTMLFDERFISSVESHHQLVVFTAAQRFLNNTAFGILALPRIARESLMKNLDPSEHATCISTTTTTPLSNLFA